MKSPTLLILLALATGACSGPEDQATIQPEEPTMSTSRGARGDEAGRAAAGAEGERSDSTREAQPAAVAGTTELATFGGGCFWCVEAVLEQLPGVLDVRSGYMGGSLPNPTYKQVCSGASGHIEVVEARFDPARISYEELLGWFWKLHDPSSMDRQGADEGIQYRSVVFTHSPEQERLARASRDALDAKKTLPRPVVTEIRPAGTFWEAEEGHQDYYRRNASAGYCRAVIAPKLDKLGLKK